MWITGSASEMATTTPAVLCWTAVPKAGVKDAVLGLQSTARSNHTGFHSARVQVWLLPKTDNPR